MGQLGQSELGTEQLGAESTTLDEFSVTYGDTTVLGIVETDDL